MVRVHPDPHLIKIRKMKFGIVVGKDNKKAEDLQDKIQAFLAEKGHEVLLDDFKGADFILTLGGDGTLLHAACANLELGIPVVGINLGKLGFLTASEADDWEEALQNLIDGKYFVSERMTLEVETGNKKHRALNEVVIKGAFRVVDLVLTVNGREFLSPSGDGVIISTQTGSTAYSLSAGGPIVDPDLDCILVTPVNSHGLPVPSVVLSPDDEVETVVLEGEDISLIVDGQAHESIKVNEKIKVSRGEFRVKLGFFNEHQFLKSLNSKFGLSDRLSG